MQGKINCIGSASDLKSRLGDGYYVHVACNRDGNDVLVRKYLESVIPSISLLNTLNGTMNFQVKGGDKDISLSTILHSLVVEEGDKENNVNKCTALSNIQDWGVEVML